MAAGLVKIKRRIASIQSTYKVTKAMQLISSSKFIRKKKAMDNTVLYTAELGAIVSSCLIGIDAESLKGLSPLMEKSIGAKAKGNLYVMVTSSLGLCGGYNLNIFKSIESLVTKDDEILIIGTKGQSKLKESPSKVDESEVSILDNFNYASAKRIRNILSEAYTQGKYKAVFLVYTHFKNALTFIPTVEQILPVEKMPSPRTDKVGLKPSPYPPDFMPDRNEVFKFLVPKYLDSVFFERFTESSLCEEGSRRNAMENASDNADDLKNTLTISYNKARQAEITNQINEIMAGRLAEEE